MKREENFDLTSNITFYEYMEGTMPSLARKWNWEHYNNLTDLQKCEFIANAKSVAKLVQAERDWANENYKEKNNGKTITVVISSGFRCKRWEKYRNRSGNSRHTKDAIDFIFSNCPIKLSYEMHQGVMERNKNYMGGIAIGNPTYKNGKMATAAFIHMDNREPNLMHKLRGYGARWRY